MSDLEESDNEPDEDIDDETDKEQLITSKKKLINKSIQKVKDEDEEDNDDEDEDDDDDDDDEDNDFDDNIVENPDELAGEIVDEYKSSNLFGLDDSNISPINSDVESDDEESLQKFDSEKRGEYVKKYHPECFTNNSTEIEILSKVTRDSLNNIIDDNHKTNPFLTKYEKTRILGQRAKQLNLGHPPLVDVPPNIIDGYLIANLELKEKKIPIIIRRPLPSGKSEYWKLKDLELI
tara:strand:- start:1548 stop:2252 length:705 start_codon:yes stop_codon:yes gene_type:complete